MHNDGSRNLRDSTRGGVKSGVNGDVNSGVNGDVCPPFPDKSVWESSSSWEPAVRTSHGSSNSLAGLIGARSDGDKDAFRLLPIPLASLR